MKKGMGWPIGIVVILSATVLSNMAVIVLTGDDPSFAVEPDYYKKAVAWDSSQALATRSDALAWHAQAYVTPMPSGASTLTIALTDANGEAVRDATVRGELLHIARASDMQRVQFVATASGAYEAVVPMQRAGMWELRLHADRNSEQFVRTLRIDTDSSAAPSAGP